MKKVDYKQIYLDAFKLDETDFIPSEISKQKANDFHHIISRGRGGENRIENLIAVTRQEHIDYGDKKDYMVLLLKIHRKWLEIHHVKFDKIWFEHAIYRYGN